MSEKPRILFMGTPDFAVPSLQALVEQAYPIVGVVTQPDRPRGRKQVLTPPPVKSAALSYGIPVFQPEKLRDPASLEEILSLKPDLVVTAAYGQLLPSTLLEAPRWGCINVHASLLPKYRGGAPIHHALINGEKETGVTIMYMVERLDAGDILAQRSIPIEETDHVGSLHDKLSRLGAELLNETIPALLAGEIRPVPQDESLVTYAPNIRREDERIDWSQPARVIFNRVRGLHPWPVAFTMCQGKPLKIWWVEATDIRHEEKPGTVLSVGDDGITVAAGEGAVVVKELQPSGKKRMTAAQFVRGRNLEPGERLGDGE